VEGRWLMMPRFAQAYEEVGRGKEFRSFEQVDEAQAWVRSALPGKGTQA
jgi:hypothetical protein